MSTREQLLMVFDSLPETSQAEALRYVAALQDVQGTTSEEDVAYEQQLHKLLDERVAAYEANSDDVRPSQEVEAELTRRTQEAEQDIAAGNGLEEAQVKARFDKFWAEG